MDKTIQELQQKVKFSYEISRLKTALWVIIPAAMFMLAGSWLCSSKTALVCAPCGIAIVSVYFLYLGNEYAKAVLPALIFGFTVLFVPAVFHKFGLCTSFNSELLLCAGTGIGFGILNGLAPLKNQKLHLKYLLSGAIIISLAGMMSCSFLGVAGILGVTLGIFLSSLTIFAIRNVISRKNLFKNGLGDI